MTKARMKAGRRPVWSAKSPKKAGAMPWKIWYVVTERLMSDGVTWYCIASVFSAGRYVLALRGEKNAPSEAMTTMNTFSRLEKTVYGGAAEETVRAARSSTSS